MREFRNVIRTIIITFGVTVRNENFKVIFVLTREALCPPFHGTTLVRKFNDLQRKVIQGHEHRIQKNRKKDDKTSSGSFLSLYKAKSTPFS